MVAVISDRAAQASFVKLGPEDAAAVSALETRCFSLPWDEAQFRLAFDLHVFSVFALKEDTTIAAYVAMYHMAGELEILNIAVAPELRRQGFGVRLLGLVLRIGVKMGIVSSVLEVRPSNTAAIALYERFGYAPVGKRPGYYPDTGEDALIYRNDTIELAVYPPETASTNEAEKCTP